MPPGSRVRACSLTAPLPEISINSSVPQTLWSSVAISRPTTARYPQHTEPESNISNRRHGHAPLQGWTELPGQAAALAVTARGVSDQPTLLHPCIRPGAHGTGWIAAQLACFYPSALSFATI